MWKKVNSALDFKFEISLRLTSKTTVIAQTKETISPAVFIRSDVYGQGMFMRDEAIACSMHISELFGALPTFFGYFAKANFKKDKRVSNNFPLSLYLSRT